MAIIAANPKMLVAPIVFIALIFDLRPFLSCNPRKVLHRSKNMPLKRYYTHSTKMMHSYLDAPSVDNVPVAIDNRQLTIDNY
jgi:hypothetical protein